MELVLSGPGPARLGRDASGCWSPGGLKKHVLCSPLQPPRHTCAHHLGNLPGQEQPDAGATREGSPGTPAGLGRGPTPTDEHGGQAFPVPTKACVARSMRSPELRTGSAGLISP